MAMSRPLVLRSRLSTAPKSDQWSTAPHGLRGWSAGVCVLKLKQTLGDPLQERGEEGILRSFSTGRGGPEPAGAREPAEPHHVARPAQGGQRRPHKRPQTQELLRPGRRGTRASRALDGPCPGLPHT